MQSQIQIQRFEGQQNNNSSKSIASNSKNDIKEDVYRINSVDEHMDDGGDCCAESMEVELSSVESAALKGFMGLRYENEDLGRSSKSLLGNNVVVLPSSKTTRIANAYNVGTSTAEESDGYSITSFGSTSIVQSLNDSDQSENKESVGGTSLVFPMAPPTSPNEVNFSSRTSVTESSAKTLNRFHSPMLTYPASDSRPVVGRALEGKSSSPSSPLHIRIPVPAPTAAGVTAWRSDHREYAYGYDQPSACFYPLDLQNGGDDDGGSVDSEQTVAESLCVEVESLDDDGTYLSYGCGGFEEDFENIENDLSDHHHHHHHAFSAHSFNEPQLDEDAQSGFFSALSENSNSHHHLQNDLYPLEHPADPAEHLLDPDESTTGVQPSSPPALGRPHRRKRYPTQDDGDHNRYNHNINNNNNSDSYEATPTSSSNTSKPGERVRTFSSDDVANTYNTSQVESSSNHIEPPFVAYTIDTHTSPACSNEYKEQSHSNEGSIRRYCNYTATSSSRRHSKQQLRAKTSKDRSSPLDGRIDNNTDFGVDSSSKRKRGDDDTGTNILNSDPSSKRLSLR